MTSHDTVDVALIGHPSNFDHFVSLIASVDGPEAAGRVSSNEATFTALIDWMPAYVTSHRPQFHLSGKQINAALVICPFLPQQISNPHQLKRAYTKVIQAVRLATDLGARVATLGGFTSILAGTRRAQLAAEAGITLTAGSGLTAALTVEQMRCALGQQDRLFEDETVAVIGATGDVGRTIAHLLGDTPKRLLLAARDQSKLEVLASSLSHPDCQVASVAQAVEAASAILVATSASTPLFAASDVRADAVICDAGVPPSIARTEHPVAATLVRAGLAEFIHPTGLQDYTQLDKPYHLFGCFSEGIVLAADENLRQQAAIRSLTNREDAIALLHAAERLGIRAGGAAQAAVRVTMGAQ
jgi:predicted amino acid dehydrogenase